ncbi:MAG: glutamate 5-kinase [Defluviitaleaceae bacterium]|nr:glutamate 5-kinase [Defluviitaleaceae bacterium]MCL2263795.1 glutamate 5-kinase [Defluviitaleaceae bacterium]
MNISPAREQLTRHKRAVVKIGTSSLTYPNGMLNLQRIEKLCWVLADLCNRGKEIIVVTSGAIGVGANSLGMETRPRDIIGRQAASAVGQAMLMQIYNRFLMTYNRHAAQILLTKDCVENPVMRENAHNTVEQLLAMGVVPIVNANDTIATDELGEFSDNDNLSADVAVFSSAKLLIMLSDIEGLYNKDPRTHPKATLFTEINEITPKMESAAGGSGTTLGTGGMATKLTAARTALQNNIDTVIASGSDPSVLLQIFDGEEKGTLFTTV